MGAGRIETKAHLQLSFFMSLYDLFKNVYWMCSNCFYHPYIVMSAINVNVSQIKSYFAFFLSSSRSFYGLVCPSVCWSVGKINIASGTSPHIGAQQNKSEWNWFCLDLNILDFQVSDYDSFPLSARGAMALKLSDPQFHFPAAKVQMYDSTHFQAVSQAG